MKTCAFCGAENSDNALYCSECGCEWENAKSETTQAPIEAEQWVTIASFPNLMEAELATSQLRAHGIDVFLPDLAGLQSSNLTIRFAHVQVHPQDVEVAKKLLDLPESAPVTHM